MSIEVTCECGRNLRLRDDLQGKKVKCPECGEILLVKGKANQPKENKSKQSDFQSPKKAPFKAGTAPSRQKEADPINATGQSKGQERKRRIEDEETPRRRAKVESDEQDDEADEKPSTRTRKRKDAPKKSSTLMRVGVAGGAAGAIALALFLILSSGSNPAGSGAKKLNPGDKLGAKAGKARVISGNADVVLVQRPPFVCQFELHYTINYEFDENPDPNQWYVFDGSCGIYDIKQGTELKKQGEFKGAANLSKRIEVAELLKSGISGVQSADRKLPDTFEVQIKQAPSKGGPFRSISDKNELKVKCEEYYAFAKGDWESLKDPTSVPTEKTDPPKGTPAKFSVTAAQLIDEFSKGSELVKAKYGAEWLEVTGVFEKVPGPPSIDLLTTLAAKPGDGGKKLSCWFAQAEEDAVNVPARGQIVTIRGRLSDVVADDYSLKHCKIVGMGDDPSIKLNWDEFCLEVQSNPTVAATKYAKKMAVVNGVVVSSTLKDSHYFVRLKGPVAQEHFDIACPIDSDRIRAQLAALRPGQMVRIRFPISFVAGQPFLYEGALVK